MKIIGHAALGVISEWRFNSEIIENQSFFLHIQNAQLTQESTIGRIMRLFCLLSFTIILVITGAVVDTEANEGKLVFAIKEPLQNEDGFRATTNTLERGRDVSNWWEFHQYNIGIMNPDGTDFKRLTDDGLSRKPRLSPDGEAIAYISGVNREKSLYMMWTDGSEKTERLKKIYNIHDFWWSATSHAVLVVVEIDRPKDRLENWVVPINGDLSKWRTRYWAKGWLHWDAKGEKIIEPNRRLIEVLPEGIQWPKWSPDKKWIAFLTDGVLALAEPDVVSMGRRWFLQRNEPPCAYIEEWSPDGKQVLFYTSGEICVAKVEKGKFKSYRNLSLYRGRSATWNPDGSEIAFIGGDKDGRRTSEIFVIDVKTGKMQQITSTTHDFFDLHWQ